MTDRQTTLSDIVDDVLTGCKSKNPQVREGSLKFLLRSLQTTTDAPGKDQIKPMAESLVSLLSDSLEPVRTSAAECLGTMMKILGERTFNPFIENVPELQMAKVKDAFGRAEIKYKAGGAKAASTSKAPAAAPIKKVRTSRIKISVTVFDADCTGANRQTQWHSSLSAKTRAILTAHQSVRQVQRW